MTLLVNCKLGQEQKKMIISDDYCITESFIHFEQTCLTSTDLYASDVARHNCNYCRKCPGACKNIPEKKEICEGL